MAKKKPWLETPQEFGEWDTSITDGTGAPPPAPDPTGVDPVDGPEPTLPEVSATPVPAEEVDEIASANRPDVTAEVELPVGETILGPTIVVRGRMRSSEDLVVHGRIEAAVQSTRDIRLEPTGVVNADLDVRALWVSGIVVGDIRATDRVELGPTARVIGDIRTPRLIIHDGAKFRGNIEMDGLQALEIVRPSRAAPTPPPPPAPEPARVVPNAPTVLRDDTPEPAPPAPPPVAVIRPAAPRYEPDPPKAEPAPPPPIAAVAPSRPAPTPPPARPTEKPSEKPPEKLSPGPGGGWFGRRS